LWIFSRKIKSSSSILNFLNEVKKNSSSLLNFTKEHNTILIFPEKIKIFHLSSLFHNDIKKFKVQFKIFRWKIEKVIPYLWIFSRKVKSSSSIYNFLNEVKKSSSSLLNFSKEHNSILISPEKIKIFHLCSLFHNDIKKVKVHF
jgi:hypothetical protein